MIFLTVGTQLPFDRLIRYMDSIAQQIDEEVIGQIGNTPYKPENYNFWPNLTPREFENKISQCRVIVSHAGIGSVLTAQKYGKPIIIVPRKAAFKEHRNEHQLATCKQLQGRKGIYIADTAEEIYHYLSSVKLERQPDPSKNNDRNYFIENLSKYLMSIST